MRLQSAKFNINQLQITKPKQSEMQPRRRSNSPKLQPIVRVVHCTPMARVTGCFVAEKIRGEFKELEDEDAEGDLLNKDDAFECARVRHAA